MPSQPQQIAPRVVPSLRPQAEDTSAQLDSDDPTSRAFRDRLRSLPDEDAKFQACVAVRDDLLDREAALLGEILRIESVMVAESALYKRIKGRKRTNADAEGNMETKQWDRFVGMAEKAANHRKECIAPLNKAKACWGREKIQYYEFIEKGWKYCKTIGTTASRIPEWEEFVLKQNQITLTKDHPEILLNPIAQKDLEILKSWTGRVDFIEAGDTQRILRFQQVSESDLPAGCAFDKYGLIISRQFVKDNLLADTVTCTSPACETPSTPISFPSLPTTRSSTPLQSYEDSRPVAPTPQPATDIGGSASSTPLSSPPTSRSQTPIHTQVSLRNSDRLRSVPEQSYKEPASRVARPKPRDQLSSPPQPTTPHMNSDGCTCSSEVPNDFLRAIKNSSEDVSLALHYEAQQKLLCIKHLKMYAKWVTTGLRSSDTLRSGGTSWPPSKRRRLSLPGGYDLISEQSNLKISGWHRCVADPIAGTRATIGYESREATQPSLSTPSASVQCDFDEIRKQFLEDLKTSLDKSKRDVEHNIHKFEHFPAKSRMRVELPSHLDILVSVVPPHVLSYSEYTALKEPPQNAILLATMDEAALVLQRGPLRIPILILSHNRKEGLCEETTDTFLHDFHMGHWIVVQDYEKPINKGDVYRMQKAEFLVKFYDPNHHPINCLDLAGSTLNPEPPCYLHIPSLHLLKKVATGGHGGKMHRMRNTDLAASQSFTLLAKAGAWSMPHIDRSGVLTSIEGIEGTKLWMHWSGLSIAQLRAYAESAADAPHAYDETPPSRSDDSAFTNWQQRYAVAPCIRPTAIPIRPGDLLLQPSGCLHSPYTVTDAFMRGTMHWDSRDLGRVMELTLLEKDHRTITNEDEPNDFYHLMQRTVSKMREDKKINGGFEWPDDDTKKMIGSHFEEWQSHYLKTSRWASILQGCKCAAGNCDACACVQNEVRCTRRCHKGSVECWNGYGSSSC